MLLCLVIYFAWSPPPEFVFLLDDPWENFAPLVFPSALVGYRFAAVATRMTRSTMLEVRREDYVRTAWVKGLRERMAVANRLHSDPGLYDLWMLSLTPTSSRPPHAESSALFVLKRQDAARAEGDATAQESEARNVAGPCEARRPP